MDDKTRTALLIALIGVAVLGTHFREDLSTVFTREGALVEEECTGDACAAGPTDRAPDRVVLDAARICVDVGYLCSDPQEGRNFRVLRWPDDTGTLRVRIPLPDFEDAALARALQSAAVRGISAWSDKPFELVIDSRTHSIRPADIVVTWKGQLSGNRLGYTRGQGRVEGTEFDYSVLEFSLATRSPRDGRPLPPEQVMLTAAHEMGHALGLGHSDRPRDVMYPENTATALTNRDYRTLGALYRLPAGAEVRDGG